MITGCAHQPGAGSYADAGSTYLGLASGDFVEANPVIDIGDPLTIALASIGAKQALKYGLTSLGVTRCAAHRSIETTGMGAAGWNIALMSGAGPPGAIAAAVIAGAIYYRTAKCRHRQTHFFAEAKLNNSPPIAGFFMPGVQAPTTP